MSLLGQNWRVDAECTEYRLKAVPSLEFPTPRNTLPSFFCSLISLDLPTLTNTVFILLFSFPISRKKLAPARPLALSNEPSPLRTARRSALPLSLEKETEQKFVWDSLA